MDKWVYVNYDKGSIPDPSKVKMNDMVFVEKTFDLNFWVLGGEISEGCVCLLKKRIIFGVIFL